MEPSSPPLEEAKRLDIFSNISVTEHPFGESVYDFYEKVDILGEGSTGEVFTVRKLPPPSLSIPSDNSNGAARTNDDRLYAMKVIDKEFLFGTYMKELRNEIEVLRSIDHPNVVRILETFEDRKNMFLIMEYCSGGDLWSRFPYTERDVARILSQILSAIAFCHKHKVVHRDVKFENILFETEKSTSDIKLIDFGTSQRYRQARGEYTMKLHVGTTYTMSPEVIEGEYSEKADVWSCGVIGFTLLSGGNLPFDAEQKKDIPGEILNGGYDMDGPEWENVSQQAKDFISSLLEYDQDKRMLAEHALESKWLQENTNAIQEANVPPPKIVEKVQSALIHVEEEPQLKRLAKMMIAHSAPINKLRDLRQVFREIDTTNDGTITFGELKRALEQCNLSNKQVEDIFHELDQNDTGVVNFTEFLAATLEIKGEIDEIWLAEAFDKLDVDNDGEICKEKLTELLESEQLKRARKPKVEEMKRVEDAAEEMLAEVDPKEDGKVSYEEFVELFRDEH